MIFLNKYSEYVSLNEGIKEVVELYKNNQQLYKILTDNNNKLLNRLISIDPTANMEKDVAGKYTKWLIKLLKDDDKSFKKIIQNKNGEDDYKVTETLTMFNTKAINKQLKHKDIFKYTSFNELNTELDKFRFKDDTLGDDNSETISEIKKDVKNGTLEIFANLENYLIVVPKVKTTSCKYGKGTSWCTAKEEHNAFDSYSKTPLYILLDKKDNLKPKYQFYFDTSMFMDKFDRPISINKFFEDNEDVYQKFFPEVLQKIKNKEELTTDELKYIPTKYFNEIMGDKGTEFINLLFRLISDIKEIKTSAQSELENNRSFMGFEKDYDYEADSEHVNVYGMDFNEIESIADLDYGILSSINSASSGYDNNREGDDYLEDEEKNDRLNNYSDGNSLKHLKDIYKYLDLTYNTDKTFSENLEEINLKDEIFDAMNYEYNSQLDDAVSTKAAKIWSDTFFDREYSYSLRKYIIEFNYLKMYRYIATNKLIDVNSINDLIIKFGEIDGGSMNYDYETDAYPTDDAPITKEINDKLESISKEIYDFNEYDIDSSYVHKISSFIQIKRELDKFNIKLDDTYENDLVRVRITADIEDDEDDTRLIITGRNKKTGKEIKHRIKPEDLSTYLLNYKLDL